MEDLCARVNVRFSLSRLAPVWRPLDEKGVGEDQTVLFEDFLPGFSSRWGKFKLKNDWDLLLLLEMRCRGRILSYFLLLGSIHVKFRFLQFYLNCWRVHLEVSKVQPLLLSHSINWFKVLGLINHLLYLLLFFLTFFRQESLWTEISHLSGSSRPKR